jgi:hypothetical protein
VSEDGGGGVDNGGGDGDGAGCDVGHAAEAAERWLGAAAAAGAPLSFAFLLFAGITVLLGTLLVAEAAALFGPRLCPEP